MLADLLHSDAEMITEGFVSSFADECAARMLQFTQRVGDPSATSYVVADRSVRLQYIARDNDLYGQVLQSWDPNQPAWVTVSRMGMYDGTGRWKPGELEDLPLDNIDIKLKTTKSGTVTVYDRHPMEFHGLDELWGMLASALEVEY